MSTWMSDDLRDAVQRARDAARQMRDEMPSLHGEIDLAVRDLDEAEACGDDALGRSILSMANARLQVISEGLATDQANADEGPDDLAPGAGPRPMPLAGAEKPCGYEGCGGTLRFSSAARPDGAGAPAEGPDPRPFQPGWVCSSGDASHFESLAGTWPPSSLNA